MELNSLLLQSVYLSILVQLFTGGLDLYVLTFVKGENILYRALLLLEIIVQAIEGTFYVWMASLFSSIKNVTPKRYFDWAFSTPIMLFTLCIYLEYLNKEKSVEEIQNKKEEKKEESMSSVIINKFNENKNVLLSIFGLNWLMLLLGYLGETGVINNVYAVILGFIPFIAYYTIIYFKYARYTETGQVLFWWFATIWAFYGKAALMPYYWKNISYNILDIFSKNFFGIYLAYLVWSK
jgi:hypothetical protein